MRTNRRLAMLAILVGCLLLPSIAQAEEPFFTIRTIRGPMGGTEIFGEPAISGDWVAYWAKSAAVPQNVWVTNLKTGQQIQLHAQTKIQSMPDISGTKVVWTDLRNNNFNIYLYDLVKHTETMVTGGPTAPGMGAAISGNRVVYDDLNNVHLYNITTKQKILVGPGSEARISGDWVVYDTGGPSSKIVAYNAATGQHIDVTSRPAGQPQLKPDIQGSIVVWQGFDGVANRIWWKDLSSANPPQYVEGAQGSPGFATISNNRIYFKDPIAGNNTQLWFHDLGGEVPGALELSSVMTGDDRYEDARPDGDAIVYRLGNKILLGRASVPTVNIARSSGSVAYKAAVTVTGSVWDFGFPIGNVDASAGQLVGQLSSNAWNWATSMGGHPTNSVGNYSIKMPPIQTKTYFRVRFLGQWNPFIFASHLSGTSAIRTVIPRVALGKPAVPTSLHRNKNFTAWGYIQPKQNTGSKPIKIQFWRRSSGHYHLKKTVTATISYHSSTRSKYSRKTSLPYSGRWRVRAVYPTSATNAYTATGWVYRTIP